MLLLDICVATVTEVVEKDALDTARNHSIRIIDEIDLLYQTALQEERSDDDERFVEDMHFEIRRNHNIKLCSTICNDRYKRKNSA